MRWGGSWIPVWHHFASPTLPPSLAGFDDSDASIDSRIHGAEQVHVGIRVTSPGPRSDCGGVSEDHTQPYSGQEARPSVVEGAIVNTERFTVLFESGLLSGPFSWSWIAPRLEKDRYDQILIDRSTPSVVDAMLREQTYSAVRERLRAAVDIDALAAPLILVGHSVGGLLVQAHARYFGSIVAGVVLVDPSPPDQFLPGVDTSYEHLRLNQAILVRALQATFGRRPSDQELAGVRQLPPEVTVRVEALMRRPRFWVDAYRESRAAARYWVEVGLAPLHNDTVTAVVSSGVARVESSLQARYIAGLLKRSANARELRGYDATHESIVFNERHSMLVNDAIDWVAATHSAKTRKARVEH